MTIAMNLVAVCAQQTGATLLITLNRPEARNAMSLQMVGELRQVLREAEAATGRRWPAPVPAVAGLLVAVVEGRLVQFARSRFQRSPLETWDDQWRVLSTALFPP